MRLVLLILACFCLDSCCREAAAQIKLSPEYSVGQPVIVEVAWPDAPENSKPTDLNWEVPGAGVYPLTDCSVAIWPEFGTNDKQLVITVSGLLTDPDGKYVAKSNRTFRATTTLRGVAPGPAPTPEPTPTPTPRPDGEAPIKEPGLRVLITYESQLGYPPYLSDKDFTDFLTANCVAGPRGQKEWRMVDPDVPVAANAGVWPAALEKMRKLEQPSILISNGKIGTIQKLPETKEAAMALIRQYVEAK